MGGVCRDFGLRTFWKRLGGREHKTQQASWPLDGYHEKHKITTEWMSSQFADCAPVAHFISECYLCAFLATIILTPQFPLSIVLCDAWPCIAWSAPQSAPFLIYPLFYLIWLIYLIDLMSIYASIKSTKTPYREGKNVAWVVGKNA